MNRNTTLLFVLLALMGLSACTKDQVEDTLAKVTETAPLTNDETIMGLREALRIGTDTSVTTLHKLDGYYRDLAVKIWLPAEAQEMYSNLNKIDVPVVRESIIALIDKTILAMNRAAEDAATESKPIFVSAITGITISDGFSILKGNDSAATTYLRGKTFDSLFYKFEPKINASLAKPLVAGLSAQGIYSDLIETYNAASLSGLLYPVVENNSLSEHVTQKALSGLFHKVAVEEKAIRKDPWARVTDLLKRVFGTK